MPNNKNERKGKQTGELSAEERFRNFFSTSVIDLPEEMTHRDEPAPVEEKPKAGLLGKLFGHDKEETPAAAQPVLEIPTGEILLGADAKPVQPEQEDMALELRTADPVPVMPLQFARTEPVKAVPAEPVPAPKAAAAVQQATEKAGISRSSFYKYKDDIFPYHENAKGKTVNMVIQLDDEPGLLSMVLKTIAEFHANILTIHQSVPVNGIASLSLSIDVFPATGNVEDMRNSIESVQGIHYAKILARE